MLTHDMYKQAMDTDWEGAGAGHMSRTSSLASDCHLQQHPHQEQPPPPQGRVGGAVGLEAYGDIPGSAPAPYATLAQRRLGGGNHPLQQEQQEPMPMLDAGGGGGAFGVEVSGGAEGGPGARWQEEEHGEVGEEDQYVPMEPMGAGGAAALGAGGGGGGGGGRGLRRSYSYSNLYDRCVEQRASGVGWMDDRGSLITGAI
jgi:hypothetical protein